MTTAQETDLLVDDFLSDYGVKRLAHANEDFDLEEEYGYFLERVAHYLEKDVVTHYGVKGMKWGQRKQRDPSREINSIGPSQLTVKTKSGETLTLSKDMPNGLVRFIARHHAGYREKSNRFASLTIRDSTGKKVGDASLHKENDDEINLVWLGVKTSERGKGYASATMQAAVDFGKQAGVKKLTLEVPGNSPDAKHIYEKLGFKSKGILEDTDSDDVWGGLEKMELNFDDVKHADFNDVDDFLAHYGVKGMRWGKRNVRPDEAERKARFGPRAKKVALGTAAVAGAVAAAYIAKQTGVNVSLGGLTDPNSGLYQATVAGKRAANVTMSAARNVKVSDIPNATKAIAANPGLKALTSGVAKTTKSVNSLKDLGDLNQVRNQLNDPNMIWEL